MKYEADPGFKPRLPMTPNPACLHLKYSLKNTEKIEEGVGQLINEYYFLGGWGLRGIPNC